MKNHIHDYRTTFSASASHKLQSTAGCRKLLDTSPDVLCTIDREGRFLDVSAASRRVWGYTPEVLLGRPFLDFVTEGDRTRTRTLAAAVHIMKGTAISNFENHYTCKDGTAKPMIWTACWDAEDRVLYCVARDGSERKAAEKTTKDYEQRLYEAYQLSRAGWWERDLQNNAYHASDELYHIFGLTRTDYPAITVEAFLSLVYPDDLAEVQKSLSQLSCVIGSYQIEHRLVRPAGEVIYLMHDIRVVRNEAGQVVRVHGTTRDITEKKIPELELQASEQKLSGILERIGDGFIAVDASWRVTYWNGKAADLLGRKKEDVMGKHFWVELFSDALELKSYEAYNRALKEQTPVDLEDYYPSLDRWFDISAYPSKDGLSIYFRNITDQKKLEATRQRDAQKLRQAKEDLQQVLESMSDGFYTIDRNWTVTYITDRLAAMVGINKEDFIGKNVWECFPEAVTTRFNSEFHRAFSENTFVFFEEYLPGFNLWFEVNAYPKEDSLSVYLRDITQKKQDAQRLEFIARATSEVIWERRTDSEEVLINGDNVLKLFGYSITNNHIHRSFWQEKIYPDDRMWVFEAVHQALEQGHDYYINEYRFRKADGTWAYVKDRTYIVRNESGQPAQLIGAMEDVTRERLAEMALRESEQTYKELFDFSPVPRFVYDRNTLEILDVNDTAVQHYGYSREEFLRMTILDLRPEEDHRKVKETVARLAIPSRSLLRGWKHFKKNGERILADVYVSSIYYKGKVANLSTVLDVTERLRLQEELTAVKVRKQQLITQAAIEAQEKERSEIGRELYDGINQLLTTAKLYVENIKYFPGQKDAFADKSVAVLQKAINEIRVLSKALVTPTMQDIGFGEALQEMIKAYRELYLFEVDYQCRITPEKIGKEVRYTVYRIVQEQLNNIVKYARASRLKVHMLMQEQQLLVLVEDNGVGFDPAQKKSGIGLSNIKNRTELFKGKMNIETAPDRGGKLEATFPLEPDLL